MSVQARDLAVEFAYRFGRMPTVSRAPGRVNLIGEHTDYNDGFVMPAALELSTLTAAASRPDRLLASIRMTMDETREFDLDAPPARRRRLDRLCARRRADAGASRLRPLGRRSRCLSDVPHRGWPELVGGARSLRAHALLTESGCPFDSVEIATVCQRAENDFVGMRCGIMDQYISCCGVAGHALADRLPLSRLAPCSDRPELAASHRQQPSAPPACRRRIQPPARGLRGRGAAAQRRPRADQGAARRDARAARGQAPQAARSRLPPLPSRRHRERARARGGARACMPADFVPVAEP